ncbi:MAG: archease [bacterium]
MTDRKRKTTYKLLPHSSDICIQVQGNNIKELFKKGASALLDQILYKDKNDSKVVKSIRIKAPDRDLLFVYWLQEMLYQFYVYGLIYYRCKIKKLTSTDIEAIVTFTKFHPQKHDVKREVKAVTHHNVSIMKKKNKYIVRFVIDI